MQCAHSAPMAAVPKRPKMSPPFLNAFGMARTPEPRLLFIRCNKAPVALKNRFVFETWGRGMIQIIIIIIWFVTHVVELELSRIWNGSYGSCFSPPLTWRHPWVPTLPSPSLPLLPFAPRPFEFTVCFILRKMPINVR